MKNCLLTDAHIILYVISSNSYKVIHFGDCASFEIRWKSICWFPWGSKEWKDCWRSAWSVTLNKGTIQTLWFYDSQFQWSVTQMVVENWWSDSRFVLPRRFLQADKLDSNFRVVVEQYIFWAGCFLWQAGEFSALTVEVMVNIEGGLESNWWAAVIEDTRKLDGCRFLNCCTISEKEEMIYDTKVLLSNLRRILKR